MKRFLSVCAIAGLAACNNGNGELDFQPVLADETRVSVAQGDVAGFIAKNGSYTWRGVPFAADTSGMNRWRAPRPAPSWSDTRDALEFSPACAQVASPFTPIESWTNWTLEGSEDCLKMDIYAPEGSQGKSLPVMVWIHGGSNVSGASQLYVGENLAANENVIVMSVQYRLGPLGWFSHPALVESAQTPEDGAANFGTLDLIAALKWIKENAGAFGGDPNNVTIFGESAGGHNVVTLLATPLAEGLFDKAIIQSGSFDSVTVDEARGLSGKQPNPSLEVAERLGGPDKFHTASTAEVFDAFELDAGGFMDLPRVIQDGVVLPETPLRDAFASPETFNAVPTISGINKDEMKLFYLFSDELTQKKMGRFIVAKDQDFYDAASEYSSRVWRVRSVDRPLAMMQAGGFGNVYAYQFDWDEGGKFLWSDMSKLLGAAHSMEIPFVFNRFKFFGDADKIIFQKKTMDTRDALSRDMGTYWANFARDGVPGTVKGASWNVYGNRASVLHLDSTNDGGLQARDGADTVLKLVADLKTDGRLNAEQRCEIAKGLKAWVPTLQENLNELKGCEL